MLVTIVIPEYNHYELTHARLYELMLYAPADCEIIVQDDCSPDLMGGDTGGMKWWKSGVAKHPLRFYRNENNLGFGGNCNAGAEKAKGDILVFLSTDVKVSGDFITPIVKIIEGNPKAFIGGRVLDWDTGWNTFKFDGKPTIVPYCEGWMIACTKEAWREIGGFDKRYYPYDYEDIDISLQATKLGYDLVALDSPFLNHMSGGTIGSINSNRMEITEQHRTIFFEKWREEIPSIFLSLEGNLGYAKR